jgi:hypothetical protein
MLQPTQLLRGKKAEEHMLEKISPTEMIIIGYVTHFIKKMAIKFQREM